MARPLVSDELWELVKPLIRAVGAGQAVDPEGATPAPLSGAQAARRPQGAVRDPLRPADGDPVGVPAAGDGLRKRDDLLAQAARVAGGWRVGASARALARQAQRGGSDRLVAGGDRLVARAGFWGGSKTGPSPVDRSRPGSKHHLIACGRGTPLAVSLTAGNRNDITQLLPLVDAIPPLRGRRGRPRRRPGKLFGDRAYHSRAARRQLRLGPRARTAPGSGENAGSSSVRSPGCTNSVVCAFATNDEPTSTRPSSRSRAASSASSSSRPRSHSVRRSKGLGALLSSTGLPHGSSGARGRPACRRPPWGPCAARGSSVPSRGRSSAASWAIIQPPGV